MILFSSLHLRVSQSITLADYNIGQPFSRRPGPQEHREQKTENSAPPLAPIAPSPTVAHARLLATIGTMNATRIHRHVKAPRTAIYRALVDAQSVATWMVPPGMTSHVHAFDARVGGWFRISLSYDAPTSTGKTTAHTDTYHGHFVELVTNEKVVEVVEFETTDPALKGEMTITFSLSDAKGGTDILAVHDWLPPGLSTADNQLGWEMSLAKLAALVETG
jgi:uncharacterized protein YndB with AHSA1/START domain